MKICPRCNRVEADETLSYCRADGTALVDDSSRFSDETGTALLGNTPTEIATSVLPNSTNPGILRTTGPTTALPSQTPTSTTAALSKPNRRNFVILTVGLTALVILV